MLSHHSCNLSRAYGAAYWLHAKWARYLVSSAETMQATEFQLIIIHCVFHSAVLLILISGLSYASCMINKT